jgi:hypothetical protein
MRKPLLTQAPELPRTDIFETAATQPRNTRHSTPSRRHRQPPQAPRYLPTSQSKPSSRPSSSAWASSSARPTCGRSSGASGRARSRGRARTASGRAAARSRRITSETRSACSRAGRASWTSGNKGRSLRNGSRTAAARCQSDCATPLLSISPTHPRAADKGDLFPGACRLSCLPGSSGQLRGRGSE